MKIRFIFYKLLKLIQIFFKIVTNFINNDEYNSLKFNKLI